MKFKLLIAVIFSVFFVISCLLHVPIQSLFTLLPKVNGLSINGLSGTPWKGEANSILWKGVNYGETQWQIEAWHLFKGAGTYSVRFGKGSELQVRGKGTIGYRFFGGAYAENLIISAPVETLMEKISIPVPVSLQGKLELTIDQFEQGNQQQWCQEATGKLVWSSGQIISPLGNINPDMVDADIICNENKINLISKQSSTDISSEFNVTLNPNRSYKAEGWIKPGVDLATDLREQLKWLGEPNAKGQYKVSYSGQI